MARARFYARGVCRCAAAFPFGMNFILSSSARSLARFPLTWAHSQSGTRRRRAAKDDASQIHTEVTELMHHDESAASKQAVRAPLQLQTQFRRLQTEKHSQISLFYARRQREKRPDENSLLPSEKKLWKALSEMAN